MATQKISCLLFRSKKRKRDSKTNLELDELHLNLWDFDNKCTYLDFGLLIDVQNLKDESLLISVPGQYDTEDIEDLGDLLSSNYKIINAIFNEPIILTGEENSFIVMERGDIKIAIVPLFLDEIYAISYNNNTLCTEITINLGKIDINTAKKIYIRFRIKNASRAGLIKSFEPEDKEILSSNTKTKILDVRVNESRWLSPVLNNSHQLVRFQKIHFFLTIDQEYELGDHSKNYNTSRSLREENIWKSYLSLEDDIIKDSLGYHWRTNYNKNNIPVENFSLLGRFSRIETSNTQIFKFLVFLFFIGLISNSGSSLLVILFGFNNPENNQINFHNFFSNLFNLKSNYFQGNVIIMGISAICLLVLKYGKKILLNVLLTIKQGVKNIIGKIQKFLGRK